MEKVTKDAQQKAIVVEAGSSGIAAFSKVVVSDCTVIQLAPIKSDFHAQIGIKNHHKTSEASRSPTVDMSTYI